jgi:hypothetical protein
MQSLVPISPLTGTMGEKEFFGPSQVKITWVNGIKTSKVKCKNAAARIAATFEGAKVHFFYNATAGVHRDFLHAACQYYDLEKCSKAEELAAHLKETLKTANRIVHIAHSHGGIITAKMAPYLTDEERARIDIVLFGCPSLIPQGVYGSAVHFVSDKDSVAMQNREIAAVVKGKKKHDAIVVLPSNRRIFDHRFTDPTYQAALKQYAANYKSVI